MGAARGVVAAGLAVSVRRGKLSRGRGEGPGFSFGCKRTDRNSELNADLLGVNGNKTLYLKLCVIPGGKESSNATSLLSPQIRN